MHPAAVTQAGPPARPLSEHVNRHPAPRLAPGLPPPWNQDPPLSAGRTAGSLAAREGDRLASVPEHVWRGHTQETLWAPGPVWGGRERSTLGGYHLHSGGATSRIHRVGLGEGSGGIYVPEHLPPHSLECQASSLPTPALTRKRGQTQDDHGPRRGGLGLGVITPPASHTVARWKGFREATLCLPPPRASCCFLCSVQPALSVRSPGSGLGLPVREEQELVQEEGPWEPRAYEPHSVRACGDMQENPRETS